MKNIQVITNIINENETVTYYRSLHVVTTEDGMHLVMTRKSPVDREAIAPVMLVHGLGQNRYTWTLTRRSFENYLIANVFETFNVELRGHGLSRANGSDYPVEFENYLFFDIPAFFKSIGNLTGGKKLYYIGHSLGGSIAYCTGADFNEQLAGIISIGGPYSMARGNRLLQTIAHTGVTLGKFYPFRGLQPEVFYIDYIGILASLGLGLLDHRWYKLPLQIWHPGSIEREILHERVTKGFDRTSFNVIKFFFKWGTREKFISSDGRIDFEENISQLTAPILFVNGDKDFGVPEAAVIEAYEKAGTKDKIFKTFGEEEPGLHWGHIDLIMGKQAPDITWPYMLKWMKNRLT